jgi:hypothetical protein
MWLLETTSLALSAFLGDDTPHYAILSHTWGPEEVSFQDIQGPGMHEKISHRAGYKKIIDCCIIAREVGFKYVWIDTCCIDKTNSTELSEAINSMFSWYKNAATCYAYLEDVKPDGPLFVGSRWFTRGWTLQELIAPADVVFFDCYWNEIGSRQSLRYTIEQVIGIPEPVLMNGSLRKHCIAEIMSWAAGRKTTRLEDRAYSLLGLFGVSMPLIYGEGENAFLRLQLEIMKITTDHSLLAWTALPSNQGKKRGALATSVDEFSQSSRIRSFPVLNESSFEMTNLGLRITLPCICKRTQDNQRILFARLNCKFADKDGPVGIWLNEAASEGQPLGRFARAYLDTMPEDRGLWKKKAKSTSLYIIQPFFLTSPQPEISYARQPCTLDFSDLVEAGYLLEAYTTQERDQPILQREECKIDFFQNAFFNRPKIVFFKHPDRATRIWVTLCRPSFERKLWMMVDSDFDLNQTPEAISKDCPLESKNRRWDRGEFVDHTMVTTLCNGDTVKVTSRRAMLADKIGILAKIAIFDRRWDPYLDLNTEKHPVPLRNFLDSFELDEDGSFGDITEVLLQDVRSNSGHTP